MWSTSTASSTVQSAREETDKTSLGPVQEGIGGEGEGGGKGRVGEDGMGGEMREVGVLYFII